MIEEAAHLEYELLVVRTAVLILTAKAPSSEMPPPEDLKNTE